MEGCFVVDYKVISTDNHIIEAPNTFVDHLPPEYKDRAPRIMRGPDGGDGWTFDGRPPRNTFGLNAVAGRPFQDYKVSGLRFEEIMPGNYDGAAALKDMDVDGVDVAAMFPSAALQTYLLNDRPFAVALMRAYNDWMLDDFCSADPQRLLGNALIPMDDGMDTAIAEFERVVAKGAKAVFIPYFPARNYADSYYDPFWMVVSDANVPCTMHRHHGGTPPTSVYSNDVLSAPGLNVAGIVERFFAAIPPFSQLAFTGLFERHPNLKLVEAEVNCGWLPFWVQMMEQEFERQRHWAKPPISVSPKEFVGKNLFVTVLDDYVGFELAKTDDVLAAAIMYSTDYPHSTTLWPKSQQYIADLTAGMDDARKHAILAGNAVRVFNLT